MAQGNHKKLGASSNLTPADNKDSGPGNSYLTIIEGSDLVSPFKEVKSIGINTSNITNSMSTASASTNCQTTHDIGVEVNIIGKLIILDFLIFVP